MAKKKTVYLWRIGLIAATAAVAATAFSLYPTAVRIVRSIRAGLRDLGPDHIRLNDKRIKISIKWQ